MLEAAMLGVPYAGRMPGYGAAAAPAGPVAPEVVAQRDLRREQDDAFEESLRACAATLLSEPMHSGALALMAGADLPPAGRVCWMPSCAVVTIM